MGWLQMAPDSLPPAKCVSLRDGRDISSAGPPTRHHRPVERSSTSGAGTSYAAPIVAFKAVQVLSLLPGALANLEVHALLATSPSIPRGGRKRLTARR